MNLLNYIYIYVSFTHHPLSFNLRNLGYRVPVLVLLISTLGSFDSREWHSMVL